MSEPVAVALITGVATVAVAVVTFVIAPTILSRLRRIEEQVANDHRHPDGTPINLRDDLDGKHDENAKKIDQVLAAVLPLQRDMAWVMRVMRENDERLDDLEDTITKEKHHDRDPPHPSRGEGARDDHAQPVDTEP